jgi:hypothetical protein
MVVYGMSRLTFTIGAEPILLVNYISLSRSYCYVSAVLEDLNDSSSLARCNFSTFSSFSIGIHGMTGSG